MRYRPGAWLFVDGSRARFLVERLATPPRVLTPWLVLLMVVSLSLSRTTIGGR